MKNFNFTEYRNLNTTTSRKIFVVAGILILSLLIFWAIKQMPFTKGSNNEQTGTSSVNIPGARDRKIINKEFEYPLKNSKGEDVSKIKYTIENIELRKEILLKGKKATAVEGRIFFIVNVKIANEFNQAIEINSKDYLRLVVGSNEKEQLAADIHNDPVKVQPISTKYTRLGFPVNDGDKKFKLKVGEINGAKVDIDIKF